MRTFTLQHAQTRESSRSSFTTGSTVSDVLAEAKRRWPDAVSILSCGRVLDPSMPAADLPNEGRLLVFTFNKDNPPVLRPPEPTEEDYEEMIISFDEPYLNRVSPQEIQELTRVCPDGFDEVMRVVMWEKLGRDVRQVDQFFQKKFGRI